MQTRLAHSTGLILVWLILATSAAIADDEGWWWGGTITGTTDYVFRGVSQTDEDPAIQGSIDFGHSSGFYAGVWASNVDFDEPGDGISTEIDYYVGWVFELPGETELDLQAVRYTYPGYNSGFRINYNEYIAAFSFLDYYTATVAWSDNFLNEDENAFYYHFEVDYPFGETGFGVIASVGFNDISKAAGDDYWDFRIGLKYAWEGLDFATVTADLSYFDTSGFNEDVQDLLGPDNWADGRVVFTVSLEF